MSLENQKPWFFFFLKNYWGKGMVKFSGLHYLTHFTYFIVLPIFIFNYITPDKRLLSIFTKSSFTDELTVDYPRTSRKGRHFNEGHIVNCILDFPGLKFSFGLPIRVFFLPWPLHPQHYVTLMPFSWHLFSHSFFPPSLTFLSFFFCSSLRSTFLPFSYAVSKVLCCLYTHILSVSFVYEMAFNTFS